MFIYGNGKHFEYASKFYLTQMPLCRCSYHSNFHLALPLAILPSESKLLQDQDVLQKLFSFYNSQKIQRILSDPDLVEPVIKEKL